jgi:uncharacterized protein (DUF2141 family)
MPFAAEFLTVAAAAFTATTPVPSAPNLGIAEGRCRPDESGPSYMIAVDGLKDRKGTIRIELYPANDADFLQDDDILINAGKPFHRVIAPVTPNGVMNLCIRAPGPGAYTLSIVHDRNANRMFDRMSDGAGFPRIGNLGRAKPKAADVAVTVENGPKAVSVRMQYLNLFKLGFAKN